MFKKNENVLVILWHPEHPYIGGSFEAVKKSFTARKKSQLNWIIIDKEESNLEKLKYDHYFLKLYNIPLFIKAITGKFYYLGRILEWINVIFIIHRICVDAIKNKNVNILYLPIAEFYQLSLVAFVLKRKYKIRIIAQVHQIGDDTFKSPWKRFKYLKRNGANITKLIIESLYVGIFFKFFVFVLSKFDKLITISSQMVEKLENLGLNNIHLNTLAFDCKEYRIVKKQKKVYEAIYLGRLIPSKGIKDIVDVWSRVVKKQSKAKLLLVGDGDDEYINKIKQNIVLKSLENNIIIYGCAYGDKKIELLKKSKLFLFLSHMESYGIVVNEAIASGLPIITYDLDIFKDRQMSCSHYFTFSRCSKNTINEISNKAIELIKKPVNNVLKDESIFQSWENYSLNEEKLIITK